ncbi:MAG: hypothetical protein PGN34_11145 [Methylobacterium frigidaeris]
MSRTASLSFDTLDPDIQDAAYEAARRAGVPLEAWVAATIAGEEDDGRPASAVAARRTLPADGAATERQGAGHSGEAAAARRPDRSRVRAPAARTRPEPALDDVVAAISRRLDDLDLKLARSGDVAVAAVTRAVEGIEERLREAAAGGTTPVETVLKEFEHRLAALDGRVIPASRRQAGRGARTLQDDLRSAVVTIRRRQEEIDGLAGRDVAGAPEQEPSRAPADAPAEEARSPALAGLRAETARLREALAQLATGRDVAALEQAVRTLTGELLRAREPADLAAITGPLDLMRSQIERLAREIADDVHARMTRDLEQLARRVDEALGTSGIADRDAAGLFHDIDAVRHQIASLADPERVRTLADSVRELDEEMNRLRAGMAGKRPLMAELKPLLEEIRNGLHAPAAAAPEPVAATADDGPQARTADRDGVDSAHDLLARIETLSAKVDRLASGTPRAGAVDRPESIDPAAAGSDLASIHGMLRSLADRLDRVGTGSGGEALDGLEKQVLALAGRLDSRASDPALAGLERTMGELLAQVALLRDEAPTEAAVERAARQAIASALEATPRTGASPGSDQMISLQAALADLRTQHSASDRRIHATMEGVHDALERLVARLAQMEAAELPAQEQAATRRGTVLRDTLRETTALAGRGAPRRLESERAAPVASGRLAVDEILEPGTSRPRPGQVPPETPPAVDPSTDVKASFIAAARRAAQTAAAEASSERSGGTAADAGRRGASLPGAGGTLAGLRASLERHRRPLLLGLAAVVLVLGAFQAVHAYLGQSRGREAARAVAEAPVAAAPQAAAGATLPEPTATQSIATTSTPVTGGAPPAALPEPDRPAKPPVVPAIRDIASLGGDLAKVPGAFSALREAALGGDGAAIYELASRAADGLGLPKDAALAAKLYERLAAAGYAPAQYRLASQYEKGAGTTRDPAQARRWYGRAAEQGHARAMHNLAVMLAEASSADGKPDYAAAASWFRRAAELGVRDSQYNLAVLLARGLGVSQDLSQSYGWFAAAAGQGDDDAGRKRDEVAAKLAPKDLAAARAAAEAWKPRQPDPAVNEPPPPRAEAAAAAAAPEPAAMTLVGAPPPLSLARQSVQGRS